MPRQGSYAPYSRGLWARIRRWRHRNDIPADRSDGRDYTGWTARVSLSADPPIAPVGTLGVIRGSDRQCGELAHRIEFPNVVVTTPLPWPGIELIEPAAA